MKSAVKSTGILFNLIQGVLTFSIPMLFYRDIALTAFLLVLVAVAALLKWNSSAAVLVFFFGALFGTVSEMLAIWNGVWFYSNPNFINVPVWLFLVWGNASAFLYQTGKEFEKK